LWLLWLWLMWLGSKVGVSEQLIGEGKWE